MIAVIRFRQYRARSLALAGAVYDLGLRAQDRLSILAMNCPEFMEVIGVAEVTPFILAPVNYRLAAPEPDGSPQDLKRLTSIGQPIADADLRIVDDLERLQPRGGGGVDVTRRGQRCGRHRRSRSAWG